MNTPQQYYAQQNRPDPRAGARVDGAGYNPQLAGLNSSATSFTPSAPRHSYNGPSGRNSMQPGLEDHLASMQLHSSNPQLPHHGRREQSASNAARQAQQQQQQQQQQYLQLQQQLVQQQLATQQMELLRLQALQQHNLQQQYQNQQQQQQQRHAAAAQQRFMLSNLQQQLHGSGLDYETQQHMLREAQASSAQEQRQAAQANVQANFRQRQTQQLYQSMGLDTQLPSPDTYTHTDHIPTVSQQQQQQQQQQHRHSRQSSDGQSSVRTPLEQRSWRASVATSWNRSSTPPVNRDGSPASSLHVRTNRPSSGMARAMTPSIVIDDSASESSRAAPSDSDVAEGDQTPETSEEDMANNVALAKILASQQTTSMRPTAPVVLPAPKAVPRALSLAAAPTTRAFTRDAKSLAAALTTSGGLTLPPIQPRRQPKGQPSEFKEINFQARIKSRLRKEAMSKLCASPRAATFAAGSNSFGSRLSNSPSIAPIS